MNPTAMPSALRSPRRSAAPGAMPCSTRPTENRAEGEAPTSAHGDCMPRFPAVIPAAAGIQPSQFSGFRGKPGMTMDGFIPNTYAMKPAMDKKVEFA